MLLSKENIEKDTIKTVDPKSGNDYVAIGVQIDDKGEAKHAALIINYKGETKLFHFIGEIHLENATSDQWYFQKRISFIKEKEVGSFLLRCQRIKEENYFDYGFFCDGSVFDESGSVKKNITINIYTNCVFFCISVISGFLLKKEYIVLEDWGSDLLSDNWYNKVFLPRKAPFLSKDNIELLTTVTKRIPPDHFFASAFKETPPIKKADIEPYFEMVTQTLKEKFDFITAEVEKKATLAEEEE